MFLGNTVQVMLVFDFPEEIQAYLKRIIGLSCRGTTSRWRKTVRVPDNRRMQGRAQFYTQQELSQHWY